ncbi:ATP-binding cassette domain-containing protein [Synechococcales cyanobacterium C]|uniref:ATP-binding cassette domain-containing protein n=1 Tax=Petrachloros mirabilis ULC683 TaxID=2781853 RepID=A0A8K2A912_9CYAN|nr:ABC transporter ATP-binding protein [Petrachloros mirabilis]NCJ07490.1 ATP-binding cassette domain-containing protein [Petrachloros mirabilis ULC683]
MEPVANPSMNPSEPAPQPVIQTLNLQKSYRTGFWLNKTITPLKQCSLAIYPGETFGLLGPNGAGKTTLLKVLLGIIRPTAGRGFIAGKPLGDRTIKQRLGYLPENPYFYDYLTGWEFLEFIAGLFQLPASLQRQRIPELLDLVGLDRGAAQKKQMRQYSKGMLQRVGMAQALINDPDLVFLDEPMSGLDPLGRFQIREIILSLKQRGKTIFFNSHVLSDVEVICDRIAILAQGELICQGSLDQLLGVQADAYQIKGSGGTHEALTPWLEDLEFQGGYWHGQLRKGQDLASFYGALAAMDATLLKLDRMRQSLEDYFLHQLRERGIRSSH